MRFTIQLVKNMLAKYRVRHKIATMYHLKTSGQVEISNREVKKVFKNKVNAQRKDWAMNLDDEL